MYMTNASPNVRGPNATYIPPAMLGLWGFALGPRGFFDTNMLVSANAKVSHWADQQTRKPKARGFASQWNIGLKVRCNEGRLTLWSFRDFTSSDIDLYATTAPILG